MKQLRRSVDDMIHVHNIAEECRMAAIEVIIEFVKDCHRDHDDDNQLVKLFFEYILEKICERTYNEQMNESFNRAVACEKRALADPAAMSYHLAVGLGKPFYQTVGMFGDTSEEEYPICYPVYSDS